MPLSDEGNVCVPTGLTGVPVLDSDTIAEYNACPASGGGARCGEVIVMVNLGLGCLADCQQAEVNFNQRDAACEAVDAAECETTPAPCAGETVPPAEPAPAPAIEMPMPAPAPVMPTPPGELPAGALACD